jgi:acetyl esterase/lipase
LTTSPNQAPSAHDLLTETQAFNLELEKRLSVIEPTHVVGAPAARQARLEGRGTVPAPVYLPDGRDETVPGRSARIGIRVFTPEDVRGVYLYIHGGGWVTGAADQQDPALWDLARSASVAVVSVNYRLAPENPYPAAPDDCEDVARWLVTHALERFGSDRLVIGGESAGAHLAVTTLLRLHDREGSVAPFQAANLLFGVYDLTMTPSQRLWGERQFVLSTPMLAWFYNCFVPGTDSEGRRQPDVSPLYADLSGMPPARIAVGTLDPLLDDSLFLEARWRIASDTRLEVIPEAVHGFTSFPLQITELARRSESEFIRQAVRERS